MADNGFRHVVFTKPEILLHATLRLLQLVLALTIAGIYGSSINSKKKPTGYDEIKWNYAVVIASFSAITSLVYVVPIFWIAVLGIFAPLYIDDHPSGGGSSKQVKSAAFVDLTNMILWFVTGLCGAAISLRARYGGGDNDDR